MSSPQTQSPAARRALPTARWAVLAAVLGLEVLAASLPNWWAKLLGEARYALQVLLTLGVTTVVFAGDRIRAEAAALGESLGPAAFPWRLMGGQLIAYATFWLLTPTIVLYRLDEAPYFAAWIGAWGAAGAGAALLWCAALLPPRAWWRLVRRCRVEVALAGVVGLTAWFAGRYSEQLWGDLAHGTLVAVAAVLRVFFDDVGVDPAARVVGPPGYSVEIGPTCSGYEGFGLVAAVLVSYLWLSRASLRFPAALLLLPLALGASWLLNVTRIAALVSIGACGWRHVAGGGFHTHAGWVAFNAVALGVIALGRHLPAFHREPRPPAPAGPRNPLPSLLLPLMTIVAAGMVTAALSAGGFDRYYPVRVLAAGAALWAYRATYPRLGWSWSWGPVGLGLVVFAAWIGLDALFPPAADATPGEFVHLAWWERGLWLGARVVGAVVTVPLAEELAFRGYLFRRLRGDDLATPAGRRWDWFAVAASSLVFGALHPERWVAGAVAGVAYAGAYCRRGQLGDAVVAHAVTNGVLAAYVMATRQYSLW